MDFEILWNILKFPNLSQVQPALPEPSQVKPLGQVKPVAVKLDLTNVALTDSKALLTLGIRQSE